MTVDANRLALFELATQSFRPGRPVVEATSALCSQIFESFAFDSSFTEVSTPLEVVLNERRGVCQDFAHLAVGCLRTLGLAARYVSGYIETDPPPGEPKSIGADASHAWCSIWIPDHGWLDFDPTNGVVAPSRHVTIGWGRDYADVAPVRGVVVGPGIDPVADRLGRRRPPLTRPPASHHPEFSRNPVAPRPDRGFFGGGWGVGV